MTNYLNLNNYHLHSNSKNSYIYHKSTPSQYNKAFDQVSFSGKPDISRETCKKIINDIEKSIKDSPVEIGTCIDPKTGNTIFSNKGQENIVISKADKSLIRGTIFTHNHPNCAPGTSGLSPLDIASGFQHGFREMRAVCNNEVHVLKIPQDFSLSNLPDEVVKQMEKLVPKGRKQQIYESPLKRLFFQNKTQRKILAFWNFSFNEALKDAYSLYPRKDINSNFINRSVFFADVTRRFSDMIPGCEYKLETL